MIMIAVSAIIIPDITIMSVIYTIKIRASTIMNAATAS